MRWEIPFLYSFLLLLVALVQCKAGTGGGMQTQGPLTYPVMTYTCQQNQINSITVTPDKYDNLKVKTTTGYCKRTKNDGQSGLLNCIKANMANGRVRVIFSSDPLPDFVAGHDFKYYELSCTEKTEIKNVSVSLTQFSPTTAPVWSTLKANPNSGNLRLTVSPDHNLQVGQKLALTMTIPGKTYFLSPQECNAHRSSGDKATLYPIWKCTKNPFDANIINQGIWIVNTSSQTDMSVSISMYAFKFIESTDVVIECSAKVCPDKDTCKLDLCTPSVRKRRSEKTTNTTINVPIRHASVSLKVRDLLFASSSVSGLITRWYAYLLPAFLIIGARMNV